MLVCFVLGLYFLNMHMEASRVSIASVQEWHIPQINRAKKIFAFISSQKIMQTLKQIFSKPPTILKEQKDLNSVTKKN